MTNLSGQSTKTLVQTLAKFQKLLYVFIGLGLVAAAALCILKAKLVLFVPVMVLPLSFLPMITNIQSIKAELKSRAATKPE